METLNTHSTQTLSEVITDSSFSDPTKKLLTQLKTGCPLNMPSIKVLINLIADNELDGSDELIRIGEKLDTINDRGVNFRIKLNEILTYLYAFDPGNKDINSACEFRKQALETILSTPKTI